MWRGRAALRVPHGRGWSPDAPWLYTLVLALRGADGAAADVEAVRIGLRSVAVADGQLRVHNGWGGAKGRGAIEVRRMLPPGVVSLLPPPPHPPRTNRTSLVPPPVLTGQVSKSPLPSVPLCGGLLSCVCSNHLALVWLLSANVHPLSLSSTLAK